MTDLRKAAEDALKVLEELHGGCTDSDDGSIECLTIWVPEVITALRAALEHDHRAALNYVHQALQAEASISYVQSDAETYGFEEPKP
jgi:hypothetical protein